MGDAEDYAAPGEVFGIPESGLRREVVDFVFDGFERLPFGLRQGVLVDLAEPVALPGAAPAVANRFCQASRYLPAMGRRVSLAKAAQRLKFGPLWPA